jgi:hypothetical protein
VILMLFFTYDVAMVFGSKLFTRSGESVMVAVALGQGEEMPMVFKVCVCATLQPSGPPHI